MDDKTTVAQYYARKTILVTGFTGLLGKLVVEKLLWSCPDVQKIYILIRLKNGHTPEERLKKITNLLAFDRVRRKFPDSLETKLVAINGDLMNNDIGLSKKDRDILCRDVNIVIHSAASVRFDDSLKDAVTKNMIGTKRLLDLSLEMKKLECFLHVSTAYSNCDHLLIKESMYPAKTGWANTIVIAEGINHSTLQILSQKFMDNIPNTYIYTKGLTEQVVNDYRESLPVAIIRPSLVVPSYIEPVAGWIDNPYGPLGLNVGFITGIIRCVWGDGQQFVNYIHTDFVVNGIILAAYKKGITASEPETPVYNACSPASYKYTHEDYMNLHKGELTEYYLNKERINFFSCRFFKSYLCFKINFLFRHMISALLIDLILVIMGKPALITKIRRSAFLGNKRLEFFIARSNSFENHNFMSLFNTLNPSDIEHFGYNFTYCNMKEVYYNAIVLSKRVLLRPLYKHIDIVRRFFKWLYILDNGAVILTYITFFWFVYKFNICQMFFNLVSNLFCIY